MNQYSIVAVNYSITEGITFLAVTISQELVNHKWTTQIILEGEAAVKLWSEWGSLTEQQIIKQLLG